MRLLFLITQTLTCAMTWDNKNAISRHASYDDRLPSECKQDIKQKLARIRNVLFLAAVVGIMLIAFLEIAKSIEMPDIKLQAPKIEYPDFETTKYNKKK